MLTTQILRDQHAIAVNAARQISDLIIKNNAAGKPTVLGLATGSTPIPLYAELVRMHKEEGLDFAKVITFNLDEYIGFPAEHPQSYHYYMHHHFFQHVNIEPTNIHLLNGSLQDRAEIEAHLRQYEQAIADAGGIDIQILGIGVEGHIGFNEAGSELTSQTRIVDLDESTRRANARLFNDNFDEVPHQAMTMGIATILRARKCILLASGDNKAGIIKKTVSAMEPTTSIPATALLNHPNTQFLLDREAGCFLPSAVGSRSSLFEEPALPPSNDAAHTLASQKLTHNPTNLPTTLSMV